MHPILVNIPLGWTTAVVVALFFGLGGLVRARFKPADRDSSYFAHFLGLNVQWGVVQASWAEAAKAALVQAAAAGGVAVAARFIAQRMGYEGIPLHTYGVLMATAFIVGIGLSTHAARREKMLAVPLRDDQGRQVKDEKGNPQFIEASDLVADLAFYLLVAGLVGSRILYILTRWDEEYARDPARLFRIWEGGLVWYGGFIGATLTAVWFVRKHKVAFLPYADILVPGVSIGHAIGRLGCFFAGCCFGNRAEAGFPLALQFPPNSPAFSEHSRDHLLAPGATHSLPVYPTQIMEAGGEVLIFLALLFVRSRKRFHGQALLTYFFLYSLLRMTLEFFRGDSIRGKYWLFTTSQWVSIAVAVAGIALMIALIRQKDRAAAEDKAGAKAA